MVQEMLPLLVTTLSVPILEMAVLASGIMASLKIFYEQEMDTWLIESPVCVFVMCMLQFCKLQYGEADCLIY
jgi:hypothetical protein